MVGSRTMMRGSTTKDEGALEAAEEKVAMVAPVPSSEEKRLSTERRYVFQVPTSIT
jgi:hypothetical protein